VKRAPSREPAPSGLAAIRRISQIAFFLLFLFLLLRTEFRGTLDASGGDLRLPYPVSIFLQWDPLVAIANALATRALYRGLLWSLAVLIPTLFLGRFFCGWVCPLGTLNHFFGNLRSESKRGKRLLESNRYQRWQKLKYYILIALLVSALSGGALLTLLDPISLTVRSLATSVLPALNYGANAALDRLSASGVPAVPRLASAARYVLGAILLNFKQPHFRQGFFLGLIFIVLLALNLRITRFWCRALCPLGALLGAMSRWSILYLKKDAAACDECNRCLIHCQGGDNPIPGAAWHKSECHLCFNCVSDCPSASVKFKFFGSAAEFVSGPDLARRRALTGIAAGAAIVPVLRATTGLDVENHERLLRPPGSLDEKHFLDRCIRCGECMKVCPNNALHPTLAEAGFEGIWTPVLVPRVGFCEPSCVLCGQVCPTGAIWEITAKEKAWIGAPSDAKPVRIGTAFYDRGRCLPWAMATECIVCEEWCPTTPKAIYLRPAEVIDAQGNTKTVRQPYLDPAKCVGCGACEYACPVRDRPAVYVTSAGESRSTMNRFLLKPGAPAQVEASLPESGEASGWVKTEDTRTFKADDLWQYIDGDAERYLSAGVEKTLTAGYKWNGKSDAVGDLYVMKTPEGAARIFDSEPATGSKPVDIGDASRLYGPTLTFRKGVCFVRIVAYEETPAMQKALVELGRAFEKRIGGRQ
jgi:polyferredoxin